MSHEQEMIVTIAITAAIVLAETVSGYFIPSYRPEGKKP